MFDQRSEGEIELTGEEGHAAPAFLSLIGAVGAIMLGIAVAADSDILAIIGGVAAAIGILLGAVVAHFTIDYDMYRRLEDLEKK